MTDNVTNVDGQNKAAELSNPGKLLRAYMQATGIHCAKTLADSLGIKLRTIQRLKLEIAMCATSANDAISGVSESAKCAISGAANDANSAINGVPQTSDKESFPPHPLSKNNNYHLETTVERTTDRAKALAFEGRYVQLESKLVDDLPSIYPKLSFPGDLIAADSWLFVDTKGKIDFSAPDDRICRLHTYLAKRNRETAAGAARTGASTDPAQSDMAAAIARRKAKNARMEAVHG